MYEVTTGNLNKAVKRNLKRFPDDFMFQINANEMNLIFRIGISKHRGGVRKPVNAFTEQGVARLSSVLKSKRAILVNIQIMRAFIELHEMSNSQKHRNGQKPPNASREVEANQCPSHVPKPAVVVLHFFDNLDF
jgi:hypothetical protein